MYKIIKLLRATERVFDGMKIFSNEKQLKKYILSTYKEELGEFSLKGDIVSGIRSSKIEGDATDKTIEKGDSIILDLQPRKEGVCCDVTRTFFVGPPSAEQVKVYQAVKFALLTTEKILKPGVKANEIYYSMKNALKPYDDAFVHHAGHKVGFRSVQQPQFLPEKNQRLKIGDVVALEPGVYIKDKFGVRLENNYLITNEGCVNLFDYPLEIDKFILRQGENNENY